MAQTEKRWSKLRVHDKGNFAMCKLFRPEAALCSSWSKFGNWKHPRTQRQCLLFSMKNWDGIHFLIQNVFFQAEKCAGHVRHDCWGSSAVMLGEKKSSASNLLSHRRLVLESIDGFFMSRVPTCHVLIHSPDDMLCPICFWAALCRTNSAWNVNKLCQLFQRTVRELVQAHTEAKQQRLQGPANRVQMSHVLGSMVSSVSRVSRDNHTFQEHFTRHQDAARGFKSTFQGLLKAWTFRNRLVCGPQISKSLTRFKLTGVSKIFKRWQHISRGFQETARFPRASWCF